ncbi:MAG: hypothetical protein HKL90_07820 [Elusimicrobia bacterium]|nr:hypothetical protein [Elusimicrobiota bacterium]
MNRGKFAQGTFLVAIALFSAGRRPAAAAEAGAPVSFNFNPQDVPRYDAVVVTVCGLDFAELKQAILDRLFKNDARKMAAAAPRLNKIRLGSSVPSKTNNAYLEDALTGMLATAGKHYLVVPLLWDRNVEQTAAAEAHFMAWLPRIYAATAAAHKPLYVVGHSWGTVMLHHVLVDLAARGSPVRVDKFITLGSPLVPSDALIKLFDGLELPPQDYGAQSAKPANVSTWINFWGARDIFSNAINTADADYRVDDAANADSALLYLAILDPKRDAQAAANLVTLDDFSLWHASYYAGYDQYFPAIQSRLDLDIPDTTVTPNAF